MLLMAASCIFPPFNETTMKQKQWATPLPALLLFVLLMLPAYAFPALVKGIVKNTKGEFLAGVTIKIKGTNTGTLSKEDGSFQLQVPDEDKAVLEISYMGYQSQEIALAGRSVLQVTLTESASGL